MKVFKNYGLNYKFLIKITNNVKYFCNKENNIVTIDEIKKKAITNASRIINDLQIIDKNKQNPIDDISSVNFEILFQTIFDKIFENSGSKTQINNSELINLDDGSNDIMKYDKFTSTLDRSIDASGNKEFNDLILNNKLDFKNENLNIKSLNINDLDTVRNDE